MAFFENWRVQLAMLRLLDDDIKHELQRLELEYTKGDDNERSSIFREYQRCTIMCQNAIRHVKENYPPASGWGSDARIAR
mgnify:CR=1 FL=1